MKIFSEELNKIVHHEHHDPFKVLGAHIIEWEGEKSVVVRAFLPGAETVSVVELVKRKESSRYPMKKIHEDGVFEVLIPKRTEIFPYRMEVKKYSKEVEKFYDPYSFMPTLTDFDLYLFNAGNHLRIYEKLGAHYNEINGVGGVQFAVWAPSAKSVSVIGDFNQWDGRRHAMRTLGSSGVWEIFIPGLEEEQLYKFRIKTQDGTTIDKSDPYSTEMELRPKTASKINFLTGFTWKDQAWMEERSRNDQTAKPISIYEVHLASWMRVPEEGNRWLTYTELAEKIVAYVKKRGFTHIELMPVMEHPFDASWGYQVTGYFAPTSRFGKPQDFMYFVDYCHQNDVGIFLDWVPAHFPKDMYALANFDGTHLYEHDDPRKGEHQDWGTYIFNYGRYEVRNLLISNALFWLDKYHIDGLRIDAVASMLYLDYSRKNGDWIPNFYGGRENLEAIDFLKYLNNMVHQHFPGVLTIAEESTAYPAVTGRVDRGGLGFDLKWNMGWMHDMLEYFSKNPVHRFYHQHNLTFALLYAFSERFLLPLSHDEIVHGKRSLLDKMPGDLWQKFANLRAIYGLMFGFPGKKLLFMGGEFGQWNEWSHDRSLDWHLLQYESHQGLLKWVDDLNRFYRKERALYAEDFNYTGFDWVDFSDAANSVISFERKAYNPFEKIIIVCNFTPVPRQGYRIGVYEAGEYLEVLNSDSVFYGGSNMGNRGKIFSENIPFHNRGYSLNLILPPLSVIFLKKI